MKRLGYRPEFAGAVEASASTGGQIMAPYYGRCCVPDGRIHRGSLSSDSEIRSHPGAPLFRRRLHCGSPRGKEDRLRGLERDKLPRFWKIMRERGQLFLPLVIIVYLLVTGNTPDESRPLGACRCSALKLLIGVPPG